jgi:serine/threonine protein kinase
VDFGVSEMFDKGNDRLKNSAGSPAFMAPELCVGKLLKKKKANWYDIRITKYFMVTNCIYQLVMAMYLVLLLTFGQWE